MKTESDRIENLLSASKCAASLLFLLNDEAVRLGCNAANVLPNLRAAISAMEEPRFDAWGNRVNEDGSLWNLDGKLAARNGNDELRGQKS